MTNHVLPADELERLALLVEELGEAAQAVGKILRHGTQSCHPAGGPMNIEALEIELSHVWYAMALLSAAGSISWGSVRRHALEKAESIRQYCHYQRVYTLDKTARLLNGRD